MAQSFLFSIRGNKEPIKLTTTQEVKKINFEPNYLNFGNGELKLKARDLVLDSNISGFKC